MIYGWQETLNAWKRFLATSIKRSPNFRFKKQNIIEMGANKVSLFVDS
jgi:hypothetical protein